MKYLFTISCFLFTMIGYSQINSSFEKISKKYGSVNILESKTSTSRFEVKKLNETDTIKFIYNKDNIAVIIEVSSTNPIDVNKFHKLAKKLIPNFKLTSSAEAETKSYYYDSKRKMLAVKYYKTNKKINIEKVMFISDFAYINELIPNLKDWN